MRRGVGTLVVVLALLVSGSAESAVRLSFDDLIANLKSPNTKTRLEAVTALGKSRRREAIAPLSVLVRDPELKVRLEVVKAFRELRDLSAVPPVITSMGDGDSKIREEAIATLVEIYAERENGTPVDRFLGIFSDERDRPSVSPYTEVDPSVFRALADALHDDEKGIRQDAARALGILHATAAIRELIAALGDPDGGVRGAAATSIGKVGTAQDGKALVPLLADESGSARNRALEALGLLRVREAGPALRQMYEVNRHRDFGVKVLECLSRIADPTQADLFRDLVQDPDPERRRLAVEGLGRVSDASMLPAFKKDYQRERNEGLKLAYSFALTRLGDRAFLDSIVLSLPSKSLGTRCRGYILEMGGEILSELYPYLNDPEAEIRAELCDILALLGDPDAISRLTPLVSDPSTKVADRANRAVERLRRVSSSGR